MTTGSRQLGLMVSTETRGGLTAAVLLKTLVFLQIAAVLFIILDGFNGLGELHTIVDILIALLVAGGLATFIAWPIAVRRQMHGLWHLDVTGVTWHPTFGTSRSIAWTDVRSIRWRAARVTLVGPGGPVHIGSDLLSAPQWERLRRRIRRGVRHRFDLPVDASATRFALRSPRLRSVLTHLNLTIPLLIASWVMATGWPWLLPVAAVIYLLHLATMVTTAFSHGVTITERQPAPSNDDAGGVDSVMAADEAAS